MKKQLKVIVAGSGALYPIYLGSLLALSECGYEVKEIAGTSGGAIATAVWSLSDVAHTKDSLLNFTTQSLPINNPGTIVYSIWSFWKHWGFIDGSHLESLFSRYFYQQFGQAKIPTKIFASDVKRQQMVIFDSKEHSNYNTAQIVRASCSIPFIFTPTQVEGNMYVDGGWSYHFPYECFGDDETEILGLRIVSSKERGIPNSVIDYVQKMMFGKIINNIKQMQIPDKLKTIDFVSNYSRANLARTDKETAEKIFTEGYIQTKEQIEKWKMEENNIKNG